MGKAGPSQGLRAWSEIGLPPVFLQAVENHRTISLDLQAKVKKHKRAGSEGKPGSRDKSGI